MSLKKKVLIVVTSHNQLGSTGKETGYYLPEVSHPVFQLEKHGLMFDIASPKGGKAPMDLSSRNLSDPLNKNFLERADLVMKIENTLGPEEINSRDYGAIFFAGGHGAMWDFPDNQDFAQLAAQIYEGGGIVAAVCHGPAALINIKLSNGDYLIEGKKLTGFSNAEEEAAKLSTVMPFLLESALVSRGSVYSKAGLWKSHLVSDQRLVTGQNPASAENVGKEIANLLLK